MAAVGTTHHAKLGNEFLIIKPNSYSKRPAPTFGARITTGDPDYNNLSIWQHWVQSCWVGGMGEDEWVDDAMFASSVGIDSTVHEQARLSRALVRPVGTGSTLGGATGVGGYKFAVYKNVLYCLVMITGVADSRLYSYNKDTQSWTGISMPGSSYHARSIVSFDGYLLVGGKTDAGDTKLYRATVPGTWTAITPPTAVNTKNIYAMRVYNSKLYVAFETQVWRMKDASFPTDIAKTWDGSTVFYSATTNSGSNYIQAMETHLGFLYFLSQNGHIHRTDGNNTFDIWSWDNSTAGVSLRSYDGKLFVGTYEYTDTSDIGFGVLYQFTGSAVTELKRWGKTGRATSIGQMMVYNRRLFYGASGLFGVRNGFGVACYDAAEDAHSIYAMQDDATTYPDTTIAGSNGSSWLVDDLVVYGGKLIVAVRGYGIFMTEDSFKDAELGTAQYTTSTQGGQIVSSMYNAGTPGLLKLWRKITVYCDLPAGTTSFTLGYSIDNGKTWVSLAQQAGPSTDGVYVFMLQNVVSPRLTYRITLKTTDESKSPLLRGIIAAYLPVPEPNWAWSFTIPVTDKWELLDDSIETKSTHSLISYFDGLYRNQQLVTFIDVDGVAWAGNGPGVLIYDYQVVYYDIGNPREADIRLTLLEAVETY